MTDAWIVVPNWRKHQHYTNRRPVWIKVYTELNSDDKWLDLTWAERGLLVTTWLEYARSNRRLRLEQVRSTSQAGYKQHMAERLNHAGFIELSASPEVEVEIEGVKGPKSKTGIHETLLERAQQLAAEWDGSSERFDEQLDALEQKYRSRLSELERLRLWDKAIKGRW